METTEKWFVVVSAILFAIVLLQCLWTFEYDDNPLKNVKQEVINLKQEGKL